jgi:hypothetical protein
MDNETKGRICNVLCYGDNASEIEVAALSAAQEFFGDGVPLEVVPDYRAHAAYSSDGTDKKYRAGVGVRAVEGELVATLTIEYEEHEVGNEECRSCFYDPKSHEDVEEGSTCIGLVHEQFFDESYDSVITVRVCDVCGERNP